MRSSTVGELVYIPSDTNLTKYSDGQPKKVLCLKKPEYLLVREEQENKLGVYFQGDVWYVEKRKVYNV